MMKAMMSGGDREARQEEERAWWLPWLAFLSLSPRFFCKMRCPGAR
jgi:hypothetical protein